MTGAVAIIDTNVIVAGLLTSNDASPVARILNGLMQEADVEWAALDVLLRIGTAAAYERATKAPKNFGDAYALLSRRDEFDLLLSRFLHRDSKRAALFRRLTEAGVWSSAKTSNSFELKP